MKVAAGNPYRTTPGVSMTIRIPADHEVRTL